MGPWLEALLACAKEYIEVELTLAQEIDLQNACEFCALRDFIAFSLNFSVQSSSLRISAKTQVNLFVVLSK